jgi:hypothetical protein
MPYKDKNKKKEYDKKRRESHKEIIQAAQHKWYLEHINYVNEKSKIWRNEHPEQVKENRKNWMENHPDIIKKSHKKYYTSNKDKIYKESKQYQKSHPWIVTFGNIIQRCTNSNNPKYKFYKNRRGDITSEELKELWIRDNAYLMDEPEIDRIDNDGVYTKSNLQYIEKLDHRIKTAQERRERK